MTFTASDELVPVAAVRVRILSWSAAGIALLILGLLIVLLGLIVNVVLCAQKIEDGELIITQQL
jgi:hypothetical protein